MADIQRLITQSIDTGHRLFNSGQCQECAEVYHDCATHCLRSPYLPQDCQAVLRQAMLRAAADFQATGGSQRSAWQLRSALDYVLSVVGPALPPPVAQRPLPAASGPCYASSTGAYGGPRPTTVTYSAPQCYSAPLANSDYHGAVDYGRPTSLPSYGRPSKPGSSYYGGGYGSSSPSSNSGALAGAGLGAAGGLAAGALLGAGIGCDPGLSPALTGGALGAAAGGYAGGNGRSALAGGLGGAAAGLMFAGADSPAEAVAITGGLAGGAALGGLSGGVGGAALGGLGGGLIGDLAVDSGPGDCLAM